MMQKARADIWLHRVFKRICSHFMPTLKNFKSFAKVTCLYVSIGLMEYLLKAAAGL